MGRSALSRQHPEGLGRRGSLAVGLLAAVAALAAAATPAYAANTTTAPGPVSSNASAALSLVSPAKAKPRTVVTTDMEQDDYASLIRYLLYTNDLDTEGIIYSSG